MRIKFHRSKNKEPYFNFIFLFRQLVIISAIIKFTIMLNNFGTAFVEYITKIKQKILK